ncbi:MAG TPA: T9SS type A sorting domain-containing protein [Chitinophagaceae bacterium]|nr:T9SS type A sorting domain-containing protein [Chitinophagaceae bacterium]
MKQRILLFFVMTAVITSSQAQKSGKGSQSTTGYAITAAEKGGRSWKEVRLVDVTTGAEVKTIYDSKKEAEPLNARTGKAVVKKDQNNSKTSTQTFTVTTPEKKVVNLDQVLDKANGNHTVTYTRVLVVNHNVGTDKPFSTNSAAMAYDKKHDRLYYTPMGIAQLRYIDLKSGNIYYFEDEAFGTVKNSGDGPNQITRMVIASDGNGYALTNDANNLIRFTTGKKPTITSLGEVTDDAANTRSVHSGGGFGGDMIADASGNLYLFTANRNIYKINIETKVASFKGTVKGLPQGFSTNGAMVEEGSKVIVASSESTVGYYRVDLETLQAEKLSSSGDVFNASDLANGNLAFEKKKKDKKDEEVKPEEKPVVADAFAKKGQQEQTITRNGIAVYPNPVTNGVVRLSFSEQPAGKYQVQLLDISGKLVGSKEVNVSSEVQIEEFRFPELSVKGNYLIRVTSETNRVNVTTKIVVQ